MNIEITTYLHVGCQILYMQNYEYLEFTHKHSFNKANLYYHNDDSHTVFNLVLRYYFPGADEFYL